jgi:DNA replication protein DnaC
MSEHSFAKSLDAMREAIERRDVEHAERAKISVQELHARREVHIKKSRDAEIEAARIERLGDAKRHVKPTAFKRIVSADDSALDRTQAWDIVSQWWQEGPAFLVLIGQKGCGKTVAACALMARSGGFFMPVATMVRAWRNEHDEARNDRERALNSALLVLDDLGFEDDPVGARIGFQNLVDSRQGVGFRTIVTTNLTRDQLCARYDDRTIARVEHGGDFVTLSDPDLRKVGT